MPGKRKRARSLPSSIYANIGIPYTTATWGLHEQFLFSGGFILIRGPTVKYTISWLNKQEPKATDGSRLRRAAMASFSDSHEISPQGLATPATQPYGVRTAADRKAFV